jgi:hypothetical protein
MIPIHIGYDDREAPGFPVLCHSILSRTREAVNFIPIRGNEVVNGSTQFNASRFNVALMQGYRGWALWMECDMLCLADIAGLLEFRDSKYDVLVCQHDYRTKHPVKFLGQPNPDYPRKNWSSLMLVNCMGAWWQRISEEGWSLEDKHRFYQARVGSIPLEWNWLVGEYDYNPKAKLAHFTIGLPIWPEYAMCDYSEAWRSDRDEISGITHSER